MRTIEEIKAALTRYRQELEEEAKTKSHYVVVSGNMCITKKGASTQYILGKGDPVPMIKPTAEKNLEKQQAKVTDDVKLEIVLYYDWLQDNIKECEKLCDCVEKSLNGETIEKPVVVPEVLEFDRGTDGSSRRITMQCSTCPLGINTCMACKFFMGINTNVYPWCIDCGFKG